MLFGVPFAWVFIFLVWFYLVKMAFPLKLKTLPDGLAIAAGFVATGLSDWFGSQLSGLQIFRTGKPTVFRGGMKVRSNTEWYKKRRFVPLQVFEILFS